MIQIQDIAHYGRWFPYYKRDYGLWWFDKNTNEVISAEQLSAMFECDVHSLKDVITRNKGNEYVALFRVDIPALEMKYAQTFLPKAEAKCLGIMQPKDMDYEFQVIIERNALIQHWYNYELDRLTSVAKQWCEQNRIVYKL